MLTDSDRQLIQEQCRLQNATSIAEVTAFTRAYSVAKIASESCESILSRPDTILSLISVLGSLTVPETRGMFRIFPATFDSGDSAADDQVILQGMENLAEGLAEGRINALEAYREFERIHPFFDGNGRVGHLLWAIVTTREKGSWPETLPPNVFGNEPVPINYRSSFGEVLQ